MDSGHHLGGRGVSISSCTGIVPSIHGHGSRTLDLVLVNESLETTLAVSSSVTDTARPLLFAKSCSSVLKPYLCMGKGHMTPTHMASVD